MWLTTTIPFEIATLAPNPIQSFPCVASEGNSSAIRVRLSRAYTKTLSFPSWRPAMTKKSSSMSMRTGYPNCPLLAGRGSKSKRSFEVSGRAAISSAAKFFSNSFVPGSEYTKSAPVSEPVASGL